MDAFVRVLLMLARAVFILVGMIMAIPYFVSAIVSSIWFFQTGIPSKTLGRVLVLIPITLCIVATLRLGVQNASLQSWWWNMLMVSVLVSGFLDGWYTGKARPMKFFTSASFVVFIVFTLATLSMAASGLEHQVFIVYGAIVISAALLLNSWTPDSKIRTGSDSEAISVNFKLSIQTPNKAQYWVFSWVAMSLGFLTLQHLTITASILFSLGSGRERTEQLAQELVVFLSILSLFMMLIKNDGGSKRRVFDKAKSIAKDLAKLVLRPSPNPV